MKVLTRYVILLVLALGVGTPAVAQAGPHFDPIAFFTGATEGNARLKVLFSRARSVRVEGHGRLEPDGTLVLDQAVTTDGSVKDRQWRIRRVALDRYEGTLTDAVGPVRMSVAGAVLRIAYHGRGGLAFRQVITLESGGSIARNVLKVRKLGVVVATLRETIRHVGGGAV